MFFVGRKQAFSTLLARSSKHVIRRRALTLAAALGTTAAFAAQVDPGEMARLQQMVEAIVTLRGGLTYSSKSGFMTDKAWKLQANAHQRVFNEILAGSGAKPIAASESSLALGSLHAKLTYSMLERLAANSAQAPMHMAIVSQVCSVPASRTAMLAPAMPFLAHAPTARMSQASPPGSAVLPCLFKVSRSGPSWFPHRFFHTTLPAASSQAPLTPIFFLP